MTNNIYLSTDLLKVRFVTDHKNCAFYFWGYRSDYKPNSKLTLFTREDIVFMDTKQTKWDLVLNNLIHFL